MIGGINLSLRRSYSGYCDAKHRTEAKVLDDIARSASAGSMPCMMAGRLRDDSLVCRQQVRSCRQLFSVKTASSGHPTLDC